MLKKLLPFLLLPLLAGCEATFTNITPLQQVRTTNNQYRVEVALASRRQTLRWDTIRPRIMVGTDYYPMSATPLMTNRWEGFLPVAPGTNTVRYRYKFDFQYTAMGSLKPDSALSSEYTLRILDLPPAGSER